MDTEVKEQLPATTEQAGEKPSGEKQEQLSPSSEEVKEQTSKQETESKFDATKIEEIIAKRVQDAVGKIYRERQSAEDKAKAKAQSAQSFNSQIDKLVENGELTEDKAISLKGLTAQIRKSHEDAEARLAQVDELEVREDRFFKASFKDIPEDVHEAIKKKAKGDYDLRETLLEAYLLKNPPKKGEATAKTEETKETKKPASTSGSGGAALASDEAFIKYAGNPENPLNPAEQKRLQEILKRQKRGE